MSPTLIIPRPRHLLEDELPYVEEHDEGAHVDDLARAEATENESDICRVVLCGLSVIGGARDTLEEVELLSHSTSCSSRRVESCRKVVGELIPDIVVIANMSDRSQLLQGKESRLHHC